MNTYSHGLFGGINSLGYLHPLWMGEPYPWDWILVAKKLN